MARYLGLSLLMTLLALLSYNLVGTKPARRGGLGRRVSEDLAAVPLTAVELGQQDTTLPLADEADYAAPREIDQFVQQLSSSSYAEREEATRQLENISDPAVKTLRIASGKGADLELRLRAEQIISDILNKDFWPRFHEKIATVEKILPPGWNITRTVSGSTPPDWWTDDEKAGFLVEARNDKHLLQIWFLPLDWIGIRKTPSRACRTVYWEGILEGDHYKTITFASDDKLQERIHQLGAHGMCTPSLINGGYDQALRLFTGKLDRVDRAAAALVKKRCHTPAELHAAIHSLIVLGVPARKLFLRAARQARGEERSSFTSVLGLLGGEEAIDLLCDIATDLRVSADERKYAILALDGRQDPRIGPAIHLSLMQMPDGEGLDCASKTLAHLNYKPAEADVLACFKQLENTAYAKGTLAQTLAAFRCHAAIPELLRLREECRKNPKMFSGLRESIDLALLRLTGDWGAAGEEARLFVVPPEQPRLGEKMEVKVYLEASGKKPVEIWPLPHEIDLVVDGKSVFEEKGFNINGTVWKLQPGDVWSFTCDPTPYIKTPGRHHIKYASYGDRSNVASFTVRAAKP